MEGPLRSPRGIPLLGFGTYPLRASEAEATIAMALEVGYRHVDTAQMYGNETEVGRAIGASGLARQDLYLVTKVDPGNLGEARFRPSVEASVKALGGPPDLLLIHWPPPDSEIGAAVDRLVEVHRAGLARAIGISNFPPSLMTRAAARSPVPLIAHQVEFHALIDQRKVLAEARRLGMTLAAYCPLARGAAMREPAIQEIATRIGRPASEVALRWIVQQGVAAIPMTHSRQNAESNLRALSFTLADADMAAIGAIARNGGRRLISPSFMAGRWDG